MPKTKPNEREREEAKTRALLRAIPRRFWLEMSGRTAQTIRQQAATYGIPFDRTPINLYDVVAKMHDLLADNSETFRARRDGTQTNELERMRTIKREMAEIDLQQMRGTVVKTDEVKQSLSLLCSLLTNAATILAEQYGEAAGQIVDDALAEWASQAKQWVGQEDEPKGNGRVKRKRKRKGV